MTTNRTSCDYAEALARGHFSNEAAALKCIYMALMSLDPTGKGRKRWTMRWKAPLNAFQIASKAASPRATTDLQQPRSVVKMTHTTPARSPPIPTPTTKLASSHDKHRCSTTAPNHATANESWRSTTGAPSPPAILSAVD